MTDAENSKKKLLLANPRGFCAGVKRAVKAVEEALIKYKSPLYVFHQIVHNEYIVENFRKQGVIFIDSIAEFDKICSLSEKNIQTNISTKPVLIFSAHGVSKQVENEAVRKGFHIIDATCPLVKKIHKRAIRLEKNKFKIILIGHPGHPEIIGTAGQISNPPFILKCLKDVEKLPFASDDKIAYLSQTTLSPDDIKPIIDKLKKKYPNIKGDSDICYATKERQNAVKRLAHECDTIFIIGSPTSSNSCRLVEVAKKQGVRTFLIKNKDDITHTMLVSAFSIGISAAASAPEKLVFGVVKFLEKLGWPPPSEQSFENESTKFCCPDF